MKTEIKSPLNLNVDEVVDMKLFGTIAAAIKFPGFDISSEGKAKYVPGLGGIVLNFTLGDGVYSRVSDHLQPDVSVHWGKDEDDRNAWQNDALMAYSCIGNTAIVTENTSEVKGHRGVVIGKHGGINEVIISFLQETKEKLTEHEEITIISRGQGLKAENYPSLTLMNIDPETLLEIPIREDNERLIWPVTKFIPSRCMGSGVGSLDAYSGDFDIMLTDKKTNEEYKLLDLRIGDFVAIDGHDSRFGYTANQEYVSIGVVVHGGCVMSGHGPGVVIVACAPTKDLIVTKDDSINLKTYVDRLKYIPDEKEVSSGKS